MSGTGIDVVPNFLSVRTGIDVVPNLPKCPVPVIPAVYTAGIPRYVPYQTHPSLYDVHKVTFGLSTEYKSEQ